MYNYHYYHYVNLPRLPNEIIEKINFNFDEYSAPITRGEPGIYTWSDSFNQEVNAWCQANICADVYWAFQIIRGDLDAHKDIGTKTKFVYLLETGGDQVSTRWFDDDHNLVDSIVLEAHRWHILKVDAYHDVVGVKPGATRFSLTGRLF